jgi:hypothetical protein
VARAERERARPSSKRERVTAALLESSGSNGFLRL